MLSSKALLGAVLILLIVIVLSPACYGGEKIKVLVLGRVDLGATMGQFFGIEPSVDYNLERVKGVKAALAAGHPVAFGTPVSKAFTRFAGPSIVDRPAIGDPLAGGHAMVLVGYVSHPQEGLIFRCLNSWGAGWRQGGLCWLTESYVRWERSRDFTVVVGWDRIKGSQ